MARLRDLPLRYRLIIPFFFLACFGTFSLVVLAIISQNELIRQEERERLYGYDRALNHYMETQGRWAVSLASSFARNPEVASALANQDRLRLIDLCYPAYVFMKANYGISQFNFHVLPPRMFLRLQRLYEFGDALSYRKTILDAISSGKETFGLEEGLTGYGIRGVAPVFHEGNMVGTIEIGFSFGESLLEKMKSQFGIEASFLSPNDNHTIFYAFATTFPSGFERSDPIYGQVFRDERPQLLFREISGTPYSLFIGTIQNYKHKPVALVEFCVSRSKTLEMINHYRELMLGIGILGMVLSVGAIYVISAYFTRPIRKMVSFAREITMRQQMRRMELYPPGELGVLANALDDMLVSLEESREKIKDYTENLEQMVHLRTRALRESEEKYRTLVESVPLVVYRLLGDGKTIFINQFITELMGVTAREVMDNQNFWKEKVWEEDRAQVWPLMVRCLTEGQEFKAEYRIRHANGKLIFVLDHALPVLDEQGNVETVDGFLVNVSDRHRLQQQIIQTEELRTLTEVSARLAHEIRNPLVAAGGFARRLLRSLPQGDPQSDKVEIIVQEIGRLERILEKTLAYLKPFEIVLEKVSLNSLVAQVLDEQKETLSKRAVNHEVSLAKHLHRIPLDRMLFKKVLESILRALLDHCQPGRTLEFRTYSGENVVHLEICLSEVHVSEDDIEHFFYPFTSRADSSESLDLPLAKMIIHKHGGLIRLYQKNLTHLVLNISLPR